VLFWRINIDEKEKHRRLTTKMTAWIPTFLEANQFIQIVPWIATTIFGQAVKFGTTNKICSKTRDIQRGTFPKLLVLLTAIFCLLISETTCVTSMLMEIWHGKAMNLEAVKASVVFVGFTTEKNVSTFPDIGESHIAPPNRTTRLCFNSGSTQDNTGQQFDSRSDPSYHVWNPEVAFVPYATAVGKALGYQRYWGLNLGDGNFDLLSGPSPLVDHCQSLEELQFFPDPALGPTPTDILEAWVPKASIQNLKTPQTCAINQYQRYWQPSQQKIIYFDPNDNQLVETPMLSFDNGPVPGKK